MQNGWTGGQYALVRILLAMGVARLWAGAVLAEALVAGTSVPADLVRGAGMLAGVALAVGAQDRLAALVQLPVLAIAGLRAEAAPLATSGAVLAGLLLALHAATPTAPFLSFDARGRTDPGGGWRMPGWIAWTARGLALGGAASLALGVRVPLELAAVVLLLGFDPGWIGSRRVEGSGDSSPRLFYDGDCGLCHRAVRFVLAESPTPEQDDRALRVAPLFGETFEAWRARAGASLPDPIPDSLLLVLEDDRLRVRSEAVLDLAARFGGFWRAGAALVGLLPRALLDAVYDFVARIRKRLFAKPADACPILPPELRRRFDP